MTMPPWEPPCAGTEVDQLLGALDRQRATFRWKVDALDDEGLATSIGASALTLGGLVKHLALVEDHYHEHKLGGEPLGSPWEAHDGTDDWEFVSAADDSPAELYALYDGAVARSRSRLAARLSTGGLDQPVHMGSPTQKANLRRLLCDLVEEYGRHVGHADLIREAVDGRVGEDPDPGWTPPGR